MPDRSWWARPRCSIWITGLLTTRSSIPKRSSSLPRGEQQTSFDAALEDRKLTHVYVDWKEINRHRQPAGYGFTDFVTPVRFNGWVAAGVLEPAQMMGADQALYSVRRAGGTQPTTAAPPD